MNDNERQFGWGVPILVSLALWVLLLLVGHAALAQVPNPVAPGYQICTNTSGVVRCSFQPVGSDSTFGVHGLPMGAKAVATCGVENYTDGTPYVLEQDLTGKLCTNATGGGGGGAVTQGTVPWVDNISQFGGVSVSIGQQLAAASLPVVLNSDQDARTTPQNITVQDTLSTTTAGNNSVNLITGSPTAASTAAQATNGQSSATVQVTGTWTGTLEVDISADSGTTWVVSSVNQRGTGGTVGARLTSFTGNGVYQLDLSAATNVRVRATAAMTGTAVVQYDFSAAVGLVRVQNPISVLDNVSGAAETIKPASTAPLTTDTTVVVGLNPGAPNPVSGGIAGGATDSGNPVKVGCIYNSTTPTYTTGQRTDCQSGSRGSLNAQLMIPNSNTSIGALSVGADATSNSSSSLETSNFNYVFNNASWDRYRSIINGTNSIGTGIAAVGLTGQLDDTSPTVITENQFGNLRIASNRALVTVPYSTASGGNWTFAAASGGISNTTTAVTIKAADASNRNCVTAIQISSDALGAATELAIRDGAAGTVLWRTKVGTSGYVNGFSNPFPTPICGAAVNTLLEVVTLTASITGAVYFNAQGYVTP